MRHILLTFLLWTVFASGAAASEINVRSGAHDGFARLVLDVSGNTEWTLEQDTTGAQVSIIGHSDGFDVSSVFDRIDTSYIADVTNQPDALNVDFNCVCTAEVFRSGPNMIVIDVSPAIEQPDASPTPTQTFGLEFVGSPGLSFGQIVSSVEADDTLPPSVEASAGVDAAETVDVADTIPAPPPQVSVSNTTRESDLQSLRQAQEKLAERISFAATTGVLRPSNQADIFAETTQRPQIDTSIFDSSLPVPTRQTNVGPLGGNLRITSSNDTPTRTIDQIQDSTTLGVRCIDPSLVRVQDWDQQESFSTAVSRLRRGLYSEFDVLDTEVVADLARLYLHYGFGAEAKQVLMMNEDLDRNGSPLIAIAEIMEQGTAAPGNHLESFMDCDSDVALWAILAKRDLQQSDTVNSNAALRTLSSLPLHLRRFLAPALSKKLLAYGDQNGAAAALRGLERTPEPLPAAGELAKADIQLAQGDVANAQDRLRSIVNSNDEQSAEALIRYVDTHLNADMPIDDDVATLVEAYAIQFRDDELGAELRRTHVLALAKSEQFDAAFAALERMRPGGDVGLADALESPLIELLSKSADDATFLEHAFAAITARSQALTVQARTILAERLTDLGFFGEAEQLMVMYEQAPLSRRDRMLRAHIAMGLARPRETLAFLGAMEGEDAERLRAQATALAGEFATAQELFSNVSANANQLQAAWLAENWQQLIDEGDPVLGPAVEVATTPLDTSEDLNGMLGRTVGALEESAEARSVIEQLLKMDALPTAPDS